VVLVVVGLVTFSEKRSDAQAQQKAQQLTQDFQQAGLPVPRSQDAIVRWLGNDGGAVCANPANALGKATLYDLVANGADYVGRRPVLVDRQILLGEALILKVYCPDRLKPYEDVINGLKVFHTIRN
jgi:hypothetical protein